MSGGNRMLISYNRQVCHHRNCSQQSPWKEGYPYPLRVRWRTWRKWVLISQMRTIVYKRVSGHTSATEEGHNHASWYLEIHRTYSRQQLSAILSRIGWQRTRMVSRYHRLHFVNHFLTAHIQSKTERLKRLEGCNQHDWCCIDHFTRWSLASICAVISLWGFSIRVGLTYRHDSHTRMNEQIHITIHTNEKTYTPTHIHQKFFLPLARTHAVIPGIFRKILDSVTSTSICRHNSHLKTCPLCCRFRDAACSCDASFSSIHPFALFSLCFCYLNKAFKSATPFYRLWSVEILCK